MASSPLVYDRNIVEITVLFLMGEIQSIFVKFQYLSSGYYEIGQIGTAGSEPSEEIPMNLE